MGGEEVGGAGGSGLGAVVLTPPCCSRVTMEVLPLTSRASREFRMIRLDPAQSRRAGRVGGGGTPPEQFGY